jgi:very-short-patch-repair endonuclease
MKNIYEPRKHLVPYSRDLRKRITPSEKKLWSCLRRGQLANIRFYRQKPMLYYILDFYEKRTKLAIELDGPIHFTPHAIAYDKRRDAKLKSRGIRILRFRNEEVFEDLENVLTKIKNAVLIFT